MGFPRSHSPFRLVGAVVAIVLAAAMTSVASAGTANAAVLVAPPQNDPFYAQPSSFDGTQPGQILKTREVTITALGIPIPVRSWQVQYVTRNLRGEPEATVATIVRPVIAAAKPVLLSYQAAIDSLSPSCDPSYLLRQGTEEEALLPLTGLVQGWTVVVPDFEGPKHPWTAGITEGQETLDGIRAAENFAPAGLPGAGTRVGLMGYSGGAQASEFAAELAPRYAPELNLVGVAAGGIPVDIAHIAAKINGGPFSGIYFAAALGLARAYPEINIDSLLNDRGRALERNIATMCIGQFVPAYAYQRIERYTVGGLDPLTLPIVRQVSAEDEVGAVGVPRAPQHLYIAAGDELVVTADVDALVRKYCAAGVAVQYDRNPIGGHITEAVLGAPAALAYLGDRFAGEPVPADC